MMKKDVDKKQNQTLDGVYMTTPLHCAMGRLISLTMGITKFISKVD
jgi:hypothetical protein